MKKTTNTLATRLVSLRNLGLSMGLSLGLVACGSNVPKVTPSTLSPASGAASIVAVWNSSERFTQAVTINANRDVVYGVNEGLNVVALDASTGKVLWKASAADTLNKKSGVIEAPIGFSEDGQSVLALVQGSEAVSMDAKTGKVLWRSALTAEMRVRPVSHKSAFVVLTADSRVLALDEDTGRRRWEMQRPAPALALRGSGSLLASGDNIYVGTASGKVMAVKTSDGRRLWEQNLSNLQGVNDIERLSDVLQLNQIQDKVCGTSYRQRMTCLNLNDGSVVFTQDATSLTAGAFIEASRRAVSLDEANLLRAWAFDTELRKPAEWEYDGVVGRGPGLVAGLSSTVWVADSSGLVHVLDATSGKVIVRSNLGKALYLQSATLKDAPVMFAQTKDGLRVFTLKVTP